MRIYCQTLLTEEIISSLYHALIVHVDIGHIYPRPYQMLTDVQIPLFGKFHILIKEDKRLQITTFADGLFIIKTKTIEDVMTSLVGSLQQDRYLAAIQRWLFHDGMSTRSYMLIHTTIE